MIRLYFSKLILVVFSVVFLLTMSSTPVLAATTTNQTSKSGLSKLAPIDQLALLVGGSGATSSGTSQGCQSGSSNFLSFPTWYEYLPRNSTTTGCQPALTSISDVWLIVAAVIDILLRIGAIIAVGMVIYGGIMYTVSSGSSENVNKAKTIIINSMIGLAISIMATAVITFIAGSIH